MRHLFLHIAKNAGSSIKKSNLSEVEFVHPGHLRGDYLADLKAAMNKEGLTSHAGHAGWRDLKPEHQEKDCFAVIRNPWARTVSRYTFYLKLTGEKLAFKNWMLKREEYLDKPFWHHRTTMNWQQQAEHVTDKDGNLTCTILRHEEIKDDLKSLLGDHAKLGHRNESNPGINYKMFYTPELIQMVKDWYEEDIDLFGFTYGSSATKNFIVNPFS